MALQLEVEVAPAAEVPWPPPLEEAIGDDLYCEYVSTSTSSSAQVFITCITMYAISYPYLSSVQLL